MVAETEVATAPPDNAAGEEKTNGFGEVMTESEAKEVETAVVGLIYPPPEVRQIVDKTAFFVAKNGIEFASKIAQEKKGEAKFRFLQPDDPYYVYFQHKIKLIVEGKIDENEPSAGPDKGTSAEEETTDGGLPDVNRIILKDEPSRPEFMLDAPTLEALDLDIVKLTAQFVAQNGRNFLNELIKREGGNFQFDFLKQHHSLFHYFTSLVDQYTKIIRPLDDMKQTLAKEASSVHDVMYTVRYAAEWDRVTKLRKEQQTEQDEKDRIAFQSIDWHDFLLVDTIVFGYEDSDLPPPVKMEDLGIRLREMEKVERAQKDKEKAKPSGQTDVADVEMDMDDSSDEEPEPFKPPTAAASAQEIDKPEEIKIRAYNPKNKNKAIPAAASSGPDEWLISPLTGEKILASKMAEHMRIGLLDPKWREQKDKLESEMAKNRETWQLGSNAAFDKLKDIASRRTDIFGSMEAETEIGKKLTDSRPAVKMTWDGVTQSSAAASSQAGAPPGTRQPPNPLGVPSYPPSGAPPVGAPPSASSAPLSSAPPVSAPPSLPSAPGMMQPPGNGMPSMPPMGAPSLPSGIVPPAAVSIPAIPTLKRPEPSVPAEEEQPSKRLRSDGMVVETDFIKENPMEFTLTILLPTLPGKYGGKLTGQTLSLPVKLTDKTSEIKAKVQAETGMPPGKQTIKVGTVTMNNINSLAFYNINESKPITVSEKTRGGRK